MINPIQINQSQKIICFLQAPQIIIIANTKPKRFTNIFFKGGIQWLFILPQENVSLISQTFNHITVLFAFDNWLFPAFYNKYQPYFSHNNTILLINYCIFKNYCFIFLFFNDNTSSTNKKTSLPKKIQNKNTWTCFCSAKKRCLH